MPKLREYLGGIISEIAEARKMTDLQTVQIAKEYAQDDLLKHFSIPRMKVGTVDLTIPFATAGNSPKMIFRDFIQRIWWYILSDNDLKIGGVKLKSMLSEMDIIMLIANEIEIKDFS